jgi:hypothetical protein
MSQQAIAALLGGVSVHTVSNRGWNPEELADRALDKIIHIGESSPPAIREQALAYKERIRHVLMFYLREAQSSERTTICVKLEQQGHSSLAGIIRSL